MNNDIAIKVENVSKTFRIPHEKISSLRGAFVNMFRTNGYEKFQALDNVSFEVKKGEFFGIIGRNGSGKSTLLKILAGIYQPDKPKRGKVYPVKPGEVAGAKHLTGVHIDGLISPFLELGIGFNPELSGRDNIYLNATVLGLTKKQIDHKFKDIVAFSELERFIDQKIKNYSSGMQVRLAFSVAVHANRDILLMDEVLAVGDTNFQSKCMTEFNRYKEMGKTVILVTHDIGTVQRYCDRAMLLRNGKIEMIGDPQKVGNKYIYQNMSDEEKRIFDEEKRNRIKAEKEACHPREGGDPVSKEPASVQNSSEAKGNKVAEITKVEFLDKDGKEINSIKTYDAMEVRVYFNILKKINDDINLGISFESEEGQYLFGYNTEMDNFIPDNKKGYLALFFSSVALLRGCYAINVTIVKKNSGSLIDFKPRIKKINVFSLGKEALYKGFVSLSHTWRQ